MKDESKTALRAGGVYVTVERDRDGTLHACDRSSLAKTSCYPFSSSLKGLEDLKVGQKLLVDVSTEGIIISMSCPPKPLNLGLLRCFTIQVSPQAGYSGIIGKAKADNGLTIHFVISAATKSLQALGGQGANSQRLDHLTKKCIGFTANVWVDPSDLGRVDGGGQPILAEIRFLSVNYR